MQQKNTRIKIAMSAAEVSGDIHGAALTTEIKKIDPTLYIFGMGGERMRAAGVDVKIDITDKSTIGLVEALRYLPTQIIAFLKMRSLLRRERPQAAVFIDAQGFNMPLAKYAKERGIKTIYYIAPQEWLWGTQKGVGEVVKAVDRIIAIFEEEAKIYKEAGGSVSYFGHPLIDIAKASAGKEELEKDFGIDRNYPVIGLFPGSRRQEIALLSSILLPAGKIIDEAVGGAQYLLGCASSKFKKIIEKIISESNLNIKVLEGRSYDILTVADVSIASSGSILLEAAILNAPIVMYYKLSPLTYFIGKRILKINLPYYSMPNLLVQMRIIPELTMEGATPKAIADEVITLLVDKNAAEKIKKGYSVVHSKLGSSSVVRRAAQSIIEEIK